MSLSKFFEQYFWLIAMGTSALNYIMTTRKAESLPESDPRNTSEAKSLRLWVAATSVVPWIVMAIGLQFGNVPNIWSYFRPQDRHPFVLAWYVTVFLFAVAYAYWILFLGGAEKTIEFRPMSSGLARGNVAPTPKRVKLLAALAPAWFVLWTLLVISMDVPVPK